MENKTIARVHSFDTLGAVDGPGLRYIIFLQGCALRCKYCQNRDTWDCSIGTEYSVQQLLEKVLRYQNYFVSSGGGVTVSGGEPLLQQDFLIEFFKCLKQHGISTAIDTSGMFKITPKLEELIKYTDLFLLDIKSINDDVCKNITGFSNKLELEFAKFLSDNNKKMWIRQVLVPGYTDNPTDLLNLKNFLSTLKTVEKVDVLPYHDFGKFKWQNLGLTYPLENIRTANDEDLKKAKEFLNI